MKSLFDSDYVKPEENFRVFQDSNPLRAAAHKEALSRYEKTLRDQKNEEKNYMENVHKKIVDRDANEKTKEVDVRRSKQREFYDQIVTQIKSNVSKLYLIL